MNRVLDALDAALAWVGCAVEEALVGALNLALFVAAVYTLRAIIHFFIY